ncbi:MAG: BNR/Asp-box repeat protein [Bacteroidetes bacterium]|nr:BNR/Asp-box repeat protein [Bacteroidota bacterium]
MKKQLLLGSLLLAAVSAFPQQGKTKPAGHTNVAGNYFKRMLQANKITESTQASSAATNPQPQVSSVSTASASWNIIGGSRNAYGVLLSASQPLQYNSALNAVSFIHRCSATYTANPADNSGAIVAEISTNWGTTWDSTALWSDAANLGRYPQGAIYNPSGNTNINNAYVVGSGWVTDGSAWIGNWYASKQLGSANYNNTASSTPGAMQFVSTHAPFTHTAIPKSSASRLGFSSTADGKIRSMSQIVNNPDATTNEDFGFRGLNMVTGTYNAGVFNWTSDSLSFDGVVHKHTSATPATNDDWYMVTGSPAIAFNEAGTHGYAVMIGVRATPVNSASSGYQPIVWKTDNSGMSWSLMPAIDFAAPTFSWILGRIPAAENNTTSAVTIPQFVPGEGLGAAVDANNKLHLFSTIVGTSNAYQDSVFGGYSFTLSVNSSTATYGWAHLPGMRPYIYDFMLDGTSSTWSYMRVDSMSSEAPGDEAGEGGFSENPFDEDAGLKLTSDARIQASRTADGKFIMVSWAESDTNFTNSGVKYNIIPDIKVRCIDVLGQGGAGPYFVSPTELNASKLGSNLNVEKKAVMHYMSPVSGTMMIGTGATKNSTVTIPLTVTHSEGPGAQPGTIFAQLTSNAHWYASASLNFDLTTGIKENALGAVSSSVVYPNPASGNAVLSIDMKDNATVGIDVYSAIGQLVKSNKTNAQVGENNINIDLSNLTTGIYFVTVKVGDAVSTKKLIVE